MVAQEEATIGEILHVSIGTEEKLAGKWGSGNDPKDIDPSNEKVSEAAHCCLSGNERQT